MKSDSDPSQVTSTPSQRLTTRLAPSLIGVLDLFGRLLDTTAQDEHLDVLVEGAIEILRADGAYLVRAEDDRLIFFRRWGTTSNRSKPEPVSRAIVADTMKSPRAILIPNASLDARYALRDSVRGNELRSVLASRIDTAEPVMLYLESSTHQLGAEHLELFQRIVHLSGSMLRRSAEALQQSQSQELFERFDFQGIVARDPAMHSVLDTVSRVAVADYPVLILGPSGSGKELIARAIHRNSKRRKQKMVVINCGAISPTLLESELFGRAAGAYTGATESAPGLIRTADKGTLLLDEIGDLPREMQVKLLRTLQFGEVQPLGSSELVNVDVRFIASTHRDLEKEVADDNFREDLFQRLNTLVVNVPALSDRRQDIVPLFEHFLDRASRDLDTEAPKLTAEARSLLEQHHWGGNVREVENEAKRLVVLHDSTEIEPKNLSFYSADQNDAADQADETESDGSPKSLEQTERELIRQHLEATGGNRSAAARALGISREGLRKKLQRLGLN